MAATTIETVAGLKRKANLAIPLAGIEAEAHRRLSQLARTVDIKGFRKGKAPVKLVDRQYGQQVRQEVVGDQLRDAFTLTANTHQLRVAGMPQFEPKPGDGQTDLLFEAHFEVYPEIDLGDVASWSFERESLEVDDKHVDTTLEILRKQRVSYKAAKRAAQADDRVTVDFESTLEGAPMPGGQGSDFPFVLGTGQMLPDFENAVTGKSAKDVVEFDLTFPADYRATDIAGKTAQFKVTVKAVEGPVLPEVDADFAKVLGVESGDLDELRREVRANVEREVVRRLQSRAKTAVMQKLREMPDIDLPKSLVDTEIRRLMQITRADLESKGIPNAKDVPLAPEIFVEEAQARVKLGLLVGEIARVNQLQPSPDKVRELVAQQAMNYENPAEMIKWYYTDPRRLQEVQAVVLEDEVVEWVLAQAKTTAAAVSFDELMDIAK
ncbi:MAG: trigger factor [Rhodocyclaceae bacterium]|nr:trigger factor [Rhodocyclaceae bacterium]